MKTLRADSKIFSRLEIRFWDAVRLLTIISQFANQKVRENQSLTALKDFTPRTKSVYQTKYVWLLFFFFNIIKIFQYYQWFDSFTSAKILSWNSDLTILTEKRLCISYKKRIEFVLVLWLTQSAINLWRQLKRQSVRKANKYLCRISSFYRSNHRRCSAN